MKIQRHITVCMLTWQNTGYKNYRRHISSSLTLIATLRSNVWTLWDSDNTSENTEVFEVLLLHTPLYKWYSSITILQQQNNFPSCRDKGCILGHMHSGSWLSIRIDMRRWNEFWLFSMWTMLLFNMRSKPFRPVRLDMEINTIELEREWH